MSSDDSTVERNKEINHPKVLHIWIFWITPEGFLSSNHMRRREGHKQSGSTVKRSHYLPGSQSNDCLSGYDRCQVDSLTTTNRQKLCVSTSIFELKHINYQKVGDRNMNEVDVEGRTR